MRRASRSITSIGALTLLGCTLTFGGPTSTSIVGNALGTPAMITPVGNTYNITGGTTLGPNGANIFHSFSTFNVGTGATADFIATANTVNILARVTGGASTIDGLITSTIGAGGSLSSANLFLINPAGIMFTSGASISLGGSFVASTADYVKLNDGTFFYAKTGSDGNLATDTMLTSTPVASFGFLNSNVGTITANGATLSAPEMQFLVGPGSGTAGVTLTSSSLAATSGAVGLFAGKAHSGDGTLPYTSTSGSGIDYTGASGFGFTSAGSGVSLASGSSVSSSSASGAGGHVVIRCGMLTVDNTSTIGTANTGTASGGGINLQADTITLNGAVSSTAANTATGGDIALTATTQTTIQNNDSVTSGEGSVTTRTSGSGNGGGITISSGTLTLTGAGSVVSTSTTGTANGSGDAGSLTIDSAMNPGAVSLAAGTQLLSFTTGRGQSGAISVNATTLSITGSNTATPLDGSVAISSGGLLELSGSTPLTGVFTASSAGAFGDTGTLDVAAMGTLGLSQSGSIGSLSSGLGFTTGGAVTVTSGSSGTGALTLDSGAQIASVSGGVQSASPLTVIADDTTADALQITGASGMQTGIYSQSISGAHGATGQVNVTSMGGLALISGGVIASQSDGGGAFTGGSVTVTSTGELSLVSGGQILTETSGTENAASLAVTANATDTVMVDSLTIDGTSGSSGIFSQVNNGGIGAPGSIGIDSAGTVDLTGSAAINSQGGALTLGANALTNLTVGANATISDSGTGSEVLSINATGKVSDSGTISTAAAGGIAIDSATKVTLPGGTISSARGDIDLGQNNPIGALSLSAGSVISQTGNGAINIASTGTVSLAGSSLKTTGSGNIAFDGASAISLTGGGAITSPSGNIRLGGNSAIGSLSVTGASAITENGGGQIFVSGTGAITVSGAGSAIRADNGGSINLTTTSTSSTAVSVSNSGTISTTTGSLTVDASSGTVALGTSGTIESVITGGVSAGSVSVTGGGIVIAGDGTTNSTETSTLFTLSNTGIFSLSEDSASGSAGSVSINSTSTTGNIALSGGGQIASATTNNSTGNSANVEILMNGGILTVGGFSNSATKPVAMIYSIASGLNANGDFVTIQPSNTTLPSVVLGVGSSIQTATRDGFAGIIYLQVADLSIFQNASIESDLYQTSNDISPFGTAGLVFVSINGGLNIAGDAAHNDTGYIQAGASFNPAAKIFGFDPFFFDPAFVEVAGGFKEGGAFSNGQYSGGTLQNSNGGGYTPDSYIRVNINGTLNPQTGYTLPYILSEIGSGTPGYGLILDGTTGTFLPTANSVLGTIPTVGNPIIPAPFYVIYNDEGTSVGSNLFLSFKQFNLNAAETVIFDAQQTSGLTNISTPVQNIIVRVTGNAPSTINGEIEEYSTHLASELEINATGLNTTANLILVNPSGINFDRNGSVSLFNNAALTLSTADYLGFSANDANSAQRFYTGTSSFDGGTIDVASANSDLGTSAPYAFGFLPGTNFSASNQTGSASVAFDGSKANFSNGNTGQLSIIAGDIFMGEQTIGGTSTAVSGTVLAATNNQVLLFSAGSPGVLTFTQPDLTTPASSLVTFSADPATAVDQIAFSGSRLGAISLFDQSVLHVLGGDGNGSTILIRGDTFSLNNSFVLDEAQAAQANASVTGGNVIIDADTSVNITSSGISSYISTSNYGFGTGGSIEIDSPTLNITGDSNAGDLTGIYSAAQPKLAYSDSSSGIVSLQPFQYDTSTTGDGLATQNGAAGNITLNLSGALTLSGGTIYAATTGNGAAGTINILGSGGFNPQVLVSNGGVITSSTSLANPYFSQTGIAGSINLVASLLSVSGTQSSIETSAGSPSNPADTASAPVGTVGTGAGAIDIDISGISSTSPSTQANNTISIMGGGTISASSYTAGLGGTITIGHNNAPASVTIDGFGSGILAGEFGNGSSAGLASNIPAISLTTTGALSLTYGAEINTSTSGSGSAGNIVASSGTLFISGANVDTDTATTSNLRTGILSEATGAGNGGKITVQSGALTIDGNGLAQPEFTGISADAGTPSNSPTDLTGDGGNVGVTITGNSLISGETGDITIINGGQISASSFTSGFCGFVQVAQSNTSDGNAITINGNFNGIAEQQATGILGDCFGGGGINPGNPTDAALNPLHPSPLAVIVTAGGNVSLTAGGEISSATFDEAAAAGTANGGALALVITAGGLTIDGTGTPEVFGQAAVNSYQTAVLTTGVLSTTYGQGRAGNLTADITGPVSIAGGGAISDGSIFGSGNGGDLDVNITGALSINGAGAPILVVDTSGGLDYEPTGIVTSSYFGSDQSVAGNAGNLTVSATGAVTILAGGQISSGSIIGGQGGTLDVTTGALLVNGANTPSNPTVLLIPTGILSSSIEGGNAGPVTVTANGAVNLMNGGQISSQTTFGGSGNTLTLTITSGSLIVNGADTQLDGAGNAEFSTGVLTSSVSAGNAGDLSATVMSGDVSLTAGGQLSSETSGQGAGGQLSLTVDSGALTINGAGSPAGDVDPVFTQVSAATSLQTGLISSTLGAGNAGNATVTVFGSTDITAGGLITSATAGSGSGGSVYLSASALTIDGSAATVAGTGISTSSSNTLPSAGSGGDVNLSISGAISVTGGGQISATTQGGDGSTTGNGGNISIGVTSQSPNLSSSQKNLSAPTSLTISGSGASGVKSEITSATSGLGSAGNITANVSGPIAISTGAQITTATTDVGNGSGDGGAITLSSTALTIDGTASTTGATGIISTSSLGSGVTPGASEPNGDAGVVTLTVGGDVDITNGGVITSATGGKGAGGSVYLSGTSLTIDGSMATTTGTGISTSSTDASTSAGSGGDVNLSISGPIAITGGGQISATTQGGDGGATGNGGNISIGVTSLSSNLSSSQKNLSIPTSLTISGSGPSSVKSEITSATSGLGSAGNISANVSGPIAISAGAQITTATTDAGNGSGDGGAITLSSTALTVEGTASTTGATGIISTSSLGSGVTRGASEPNGDAGVITLTVAGAVAITDGGVITSATGGKGAGGSVYLSGTSLTIDGSTATTTGTGISTSSTDASTSAGSGGDVNLSISGPIAITGGGQISATTQGGDGGATGNGGNIYIGVTSLSSNLSSSQKNLSIPTSLTISGSGPSSVKSEITSATSGLGSAGNIGANVSGPVTLSAGGQIYTGAIDLGGGSGNGGAITLNSTSLTVNGTGSTTGATGIISTSSLGSGVTPGASELNGDAGVITLTVAGDVALTDGGVITSATGGAGAGGSVYLSARSLTIDGSMAATAGTGISTSSTDASTSAGSGGDVNLSIRGAISVTGGGQISATTQGGDGSTTGNGGNIYIGVTSLSPNLSPSQKKLSTPTRLTISGSGLSGVNSEITSATSGPGSAGNISANVSGPVTIAAGGQISTGATDLGHGSGDGGTIALNSSALTVNGAGASSGSTGIFSTSALQSGVTPGSSEPNGDAGVVNLTVTGPVSLTSGGRISSSTTSNGAAGAVALSASSLAIDGATSEISTSSSGPANATSGANMIGTINLTVPGPITIAGGAQVTATTSTGQNGGNVNILEAGSGGVTLTGTGSAITAAASGNGNGGDITLNTAGTLTISANATITCSSEQSNAGNLTISAENLIMNHGGSIDTTADAPVTSAGSSVGNGGNISITVGKLVYLLHSDILTRATNVGGNITIDPQFVILNSSVISAAGGYGDGNISIAANFLLSSSSTIVATGSVTLDTVPLDLSGSLLALPGQLTDEEKRLRESCARAANHEFSSLIVVGRGGTESAPEELQPDFGIDALPQPTGVSAKSVQ